ncbi:hypothetical protein PDE_00411 [Penicillium oxalicum 114-2]|uniref:Uncharacterized protein n=1 Tax=Penicillium oxalicum (strain 114-2 / CGMCC 5302) TaxID=933388 RepID=S8AIB6_PENO1|nr:hypothetical protein PDE_00411 [Penicillium oxalicum 114-2]
MGWNWALRIKHLEAAECGPLARYERVYALNAVDDCALHDPVSQSREPELKWHQRHRNDDAHALRRPLRVWSFGGDGVGGHFHQFTRGPTPKRQRGGERWGRQHHNVRGSGDPPVQVTWVNMAHYAYVGH